MIRTNKFDLSSYTNYSASYLQLIRSMLDMNPDNRPTATEILDKYLLSDLECQLKFEKELNKQMRAKLAQFENTKLCNRKKSI